MLRDCGGRVIVTGMGKSGLIGRKIAATLASTGTPAYFLHPAEGVHGDLGMVARGDVVVALSNSGETDEVLAILPLLKRLGVPIVLLTGNPGSALARQCEVVLDVSVPEEACPMNLAPTSSTTAALAAGDALALALLELRGLRPEDYAALHPRGALGWRALFRVDDLMLTGDAIPIVPDTTPLREVIVEITQKRRGMTTVVDSEGRLLGVITDGDLRRLHLRGGAIDELTAGQVASREPKIDPRRGPGREGARGDGDLADHESGDRRRGSTARRAHSHARHASGQDRIVFRVFQLFWLSHLCWRGTKIAFRHDFPLESTER